MGYLQFETGFVPATDSPEFSSRYSLNEVIKLAAAPRLEFLVAAEPLAHFTVDRTTANRVADIFVGAQAVLYRGEGAKPTLAVGYFDRACDGGAPEFDYGSPTNSFLALASADVKGFHYDANAFFTELEQGPVRRGQFGQSLTISHPCPAPLHVVRRAMALHPAILGEQCGRESLGSQLCGAENVGLRYRVPSRSNGDIHKVGGVRRLHLSCAASSLGSPIAF